MGEVIHDGAGGFNIRCINAAGTYAVWSQTSATVPFTWAEGDKIMLHGWYFVS